MIEEKNYIGGDDKTFYIIWCLRSFTNSELKVKIEDTFFFVDGFLWAASANGLSYIKWRYNLRKWRKIWRLTWGGTWRVDSWSWQVQRGWLEVRLDVSSTKGAAPDDVAWAGGTGTWGGDCAGRAVAIRRDAGSAGGWVGGWITQ